MLLVTQGSIGQNHDTWPWKSPWSTKYQQHPLIRNTARVHGLRLSNLGPHGRWPCLAILLPFAVSGQILVASENPTFKRKALDASHNAGSQRFEREFHPSLGVLNS